MRKISKEEKKKRSAELRARKHLNDLDRLLRRYNPEELSISASRLLHAIMPKPDQWYLYPPHLLIKAIEVNYAFFRGHRNQPVTPNAFIQILNRLKDYHDPYIDHILSDRKSMELFALAVSREQFDLQSSPSMHDFSRTLILFYKNDPIPKSGAEFELHYGISIHDWILMCFSIHAHVAGRDVPLIHTNHYKETEIPGFPIEAVEPFFARASSTPRDAGAEFLRRREKYPPHLHIFIKSVFFDYPLISFGDGQYLVVHPYLVFHFANEGIYKSCISLSPESFYPEFSNSFEKYVDELLHDFFPEDCVHNEVEIQAISPGKCCDFMVGTDECILLIECKAIRYSSDLLTENALLKDNSTGKIADAYQQLHDTASRLKSGEMNTLVDPNEKVICSIVVTYGELYFANSDFYFNSFISNRMDPIVLDDWPGVLKDRPQIMRTDTFERFLVVNRETGIQPSSLISKKLGEDFDKVGDWPQYLQTFSTQIENWDIPVLDNASDEFFHEALFSGMP